MENVIVENSLVQEKTVSEFQKPKGLKLLKTHIVTEIVSLIFGCLIVAGIALFLAYFISQKTSTISNTVSTIFVTSVIANVLILIVLGIISFVVNAKMSKINEYFAMVWKSSIKSVGANLANNAVKGIFRNSLVSEISDATNSVYQAYQGFKRVKFAFEGFDLEIKKVSDSTLNKDKYYKRYITCFILSFVTIILSVFAFLPFEINGANTYMYVIHICLLGVAIITSLIPAVIFLSYKMKAYKIFENNQIEEK